MMKTCQILPVVSSDHHLPLEEVTPPSESTVPEDVLADQAGLDPRYPFVSGSLDQLYKTQTKHLSELNNQMQCSSTPGIDSTGLRPFGRVSALWW